MHLDIVQLLTQLVAFLIFMWILSRYAFGPVMKVLEERRQKIASEFKRIDDLENKYKRLESDYKEKLDQIDSLTQKKIQESIAEGHKIAAEITETAREESKDILERAKKTIQIEVDKAKINLKFEIINLIMNATEKVIEVKLDEKKDKELVVQFIEAIEKKSKTSQN